MVGELADRVRAAEAGAHRETFPLESVTVLVLGTVRVLGTICGKYDTVTNLFNSSEKKEASSLFYIFASIFDDNC